VVSSKNGLTYRRGGGKQLNRCNLYHGASARWGNDPVKRLGKKKGVAQGGGGRPEEPWGNALYGEERHSRPAQKR